MNYYEHHLGDYAEATAHLSFVEDAAYSRLMRKVYSTEHPLPLDLRAVQRLVGARSREERRAVETVLGEFFELCEDGYHNERCDAEIARFQDKQRKAKASADARWSHTERNANASPTPDANALRTQSEGNALQSPDTRHQKEKRQDPSGLPVSSLRADPAPPPSPFDGLNAQALNGKAVVTLAATWELPEEWGNDAVALGFQPREVLHEAERYRQFWTAGRGANKRKSVKGWRQAWSNWLGKAAENRR